ncbi:MAG TPA: glutamine synthetase [Rhodospirillaceae bacterium]|nr:glutamine synthetase [Rhodospirillaceae bacterium]MBB56180.1 glutamine synthetase [Rhodospirillaceae bacterium]HBM13789.1 glutamine synthetase [Rhodospirillaceae bacterium]|tara:strand:+ start:26769 stop:28280 length:1512 start_codon:yes stop_codon:yes gene_type:complete
MGNAKGQSGAEGFIARYGLWDAQQHGLVQDCLDQIQNEQITLIRLIWCDTHGITRAKAVTPQAFKSVLVNGYSIGAGSWSLDASGGRVFQTFTAGGGMGLSEMTGSPNLILVPDLTSFRLATWAPGVALVVCDDYFRDGRPFYFSPRHILRKALTPLVDRGITPLIGLEIEWTLMRLSDDGAITAPEINGPGQRGAPPNCLPAEPGFSYDSETNLDRVQSLLTTLTTHYSDLDLGLRSLDNELGAGQIECTFFPKPAWEAATDALIFRSATRQICRRHGHLASFMTFPDGAGLFPSGWHLHLSLTDTKSGRNLFMPVEGETCLSPMGMKFLAGQLAHAQEGIAFATPSVNGYRRFRMNSLAPDRVSWNVQHRGVMLRVLGGAQDPASRIENRVGEPCANPYLFIAAQIAAGLDGMERNLTPWAADDNPYQSDRPMLPTSLKDALDGLQQSSFYRQTFGDIYIDYFLRMKRAEVARYEAFLNADRVDPTKGVTAWEMREYFDAF